MGLSKYRSFIVLRIILLLINLIAISILSVHLKWFFTTSILVAILVLQIIEFFRFSFKIKNDLDNLIRLFEQNDFSSKALTIDYKPRFRESENSFYRIKTIIKNSKIEREVQFNFLKILIENVPSGIIVIKNNLLYLSNKAAKDILNLNNLDSLSILKINFSEFYQIITNRNHVKSELIALSHNHNKIQLSFSITSLILLKENTKIVNFQNIKTALEKNELLAWNKLIRTMTHEIMNSVTPLISLSEAGYIISNENGYPKKIENLNQKNIDHIFKSFKSIHNKSIWLKEFVDDYRKLIRIPQPKISNFKLSQFIDNVIESMSELFKKENIKVINSTEDYDIFADKNLIELIIINLIKNAIDSLKNTENKSIKITSNKNNDITSLHIIDNGKGIPESIMDQIFVPFFSTKEDGSGIGLSVVKQIMQMHNGIVNVSSYKNLTTFTLQFRD